uniref:Uncharacterized protein n=1 Tax=Hemiselmis andersenii TaxID=464988 RepID=A0A6T8HJP9_HEMAN|mmetsp:Transcript_33814/g.79214  ORF Transcript_33814/g.79214 Transcript_33814/m.79214 type:complete len:227 (+) Transcript_33814:176-856(+)
MPNGALRDARANAMKTKLGYGVKVDPLPWSTGLCDFWSDPELLYMSTHGIGGVCCFICLPAKTRVDYMNSEDVWTRKTDPRRTSAADVGILGECNVKFSSASWAYLWNASLLAAFPPIRYWWRWSFRKKYVVKGTLIGDIISSTFCYLCAALQEQREVRVARDPLFVAVKKIDGAALPTTFNALYSAEVPKQAMMNKPSSKPGSSVKESGASGTPMSEVVVVGNSD